LQALLVMESERIEKRRRKNSLFYHCCLLNPADATLYLLFLPIQGLRSFSYRSVLGWWEWTSCFLSRPFTNIYICPCLYIYVRRTHADKEFLRTDFLFLPE
jgi:hypothetical protein